MLAAEEPVAQAIVHGPFAQAGVGQIAGDLLFEGRRRRAVVFPRVDRRPLAGEAGFFPAVDGPREGRLLAGGLVPGGRVDDLDNGQVELDGEFPVVQIVPGTAMMAPVP